MLLNNKLQIYELTYLLNNNFRSHIINSPDFKFNYTYELQITNMYQDNLDRYSLFVLPDLLYLKNKSRLQIFREKW